MNLNLMMFIQGNLPKIKDGAYVISLNDHKSVGTPLYVNGDNRTYFDNFGIEHISKEIKKSIGNIHITTNIYRIQAYDSVMHLLILC